MAKRMVPRRKDWPEIIDALVQHYGTLKAVADEIGLRPTTLYSIRSGAEPLYGHGEMILDAHARIRPIVEDTS